MSNETISNQNVPLPKARGAGFFWLLTIVTGMFAYIVAGKFIVTSDPALTAANVLAHDSAFRLAGSANLVATICYLCVTLLMFQLLRPLNATVALFGLLASLVGCTVGAISCLFFLAPIAMTDRGQAASLLFLSAQANDIGMVFFGCHVLSIGYVICRSSVVPRILGLLLCFTGVCYLTNSFANFLALPFKSYLLPFVAAGGLLGEGALTFWLLFKGVNVQLWRKQSAHLWTNAVPQTLTLIAVFCLSASGPALAQENPVQLKQRVLAQAQSRTPGDYAFTRTVRTEGTQGGKTEKKIIVEKYDPTKPADVRWMLVSVDGAAPSADALNTFRKEAAKRHIVPGYHRIANYFAAPATTSTDSRGRTLFYFDSLSKGSVSVLESDVSQNASAEASIGQAGETPFVEQVRISVKPMRLKLVMKLEKFETTAHYRIGADGKPILTESTTDMSGSGMGQEGSMHTVATYSDYRVVR